MTCATDSFNRADSAVTLGNADTGQTWIELDQFSLGGTWGISSNQAYCPAGQAGAPLIAALLPTGLTTGYRAQQTFAVQHLFVGAQTFPTLIVGADSLSPSTSAWYQIQNSGTGHGVINTFRGFAGAQTIALGFDIADGDVIAVDVIDSPVISADYLGKTLAIYRNGVLQLTHVARISTDWGAVTPTTFGQYHGFSSQSNLGVERVDDFSVCPVTVGGWTVGYLPIGAG